MDEDVNVLRAVPWGAPALALLSHAKHLAPDAPAIVMVRHSEWDDMGEIKDLRAMPLDERGEQAALISQTDSIANCRDPISPSFGDDGELLGDKAALGEGGEDVDGVGASLGRAHLSEQVVESLGCQEAADALPGKASVELVSFGLELGGGEVFGVVGGLEDSASRAVGGVEKSEAVHDVVEFRAFVGLYDVGVYHVESAGFGELDGLFDAFGCLLGEADEEVSIGPDAEFVATAYGVSDLVEVDGFSHVFEHFGVAGLDGEAGAVESGVAHGAKDVFGDFPDVESDGYGPSDVDVAALNLFADVHDALDVGDEAVVEERDFAHAVGFGEVCDFVDDVLGGSGPLLAPYVGG